MTRYDERYDAWHGVVEAALSGVMDACTAPRPLLDAMRYSLLAGGKRLRPILLLAACDAGGGDTSAALPYACALEMIHTYSLVHDDLPAMDDDDLRRGKPTNHKVYGEAMAILAGDGLLSLAFETMLNAAQTPDDIAAMRALGRAAGVTGMVGGQCADIQSERTGQANADTLAYIHRNKTAALFVGAAQAGLHLARAPQALLAAGEAYARALGTAFQIRDDLLDVQGDASVLGKATGMDAAHGKLTWPGFFGVEKATADLGQKTDEALAALDAFGEGGSFLREMALRLLQRDR